MFEESSKSRGVFRNQVSIYDEVHYFHNNTVLINQFVRPTFCLCSAFVDINFRGMLHHICDMPMTKTCVNQSEVVNVGAQID